MSRTKKEKKLVRVTPEQAKMVADNIKLAYSYVHKQFGGLDIEKRRELIEDAKLAMLETVSLYEPSKGSYSNFVYNVLHFKLMNQYYKYRKHFTVLDFDDNRPGKDDIYEEDFDFETRDKLKAALIELPEQQREVVQMLYMDGYTAAEIREKLGIKRDKDIYRLRRKAIAALRKKMGITLRGGNKYE